MSQTFRRERREKYTAALSGFGFALFLTALTAGDIGEIPPTDRGAAWNQFLLSVAIVGIPTAIWLWSLTPWGEVPPEKQRLGIAGIVTAGAGGSTINFFLQKDPDLLRIFIGACVGFSLGAGIVFLLIGLLRRWRSAENAIRD